MEKRTAIAAVIVASIVVVASVTAYMLSRPGEKQNAVYYTSVPPGLMDSWLANNQSSGYIAWEPFVSSSVVAGTGRVLMWSEEIMPHHPCCVVVVSNAFLAKDFGGGVTGKDLAVRFTKAHMDATIWIQDSLANPNGANYTKLISMASNFTLRGSAVVEEAFTHVKYSYEMNSSFTDALGQFAGMFKNYSLITNATLASRGYGSIPDFVNDYVNETYLTDAASVTPSTTILNPTDAIDLGFLSGDLHEVAQYVASNESWFGGTSMFEKYGLNVTKNTAYLNGNAEMAAFKAGEVDIGHLGAPPAILKRLNEDTKTTIIAQANIEGSGLVVAAHSNVHSLKDLVGKTVATPGEASIQHLLLKIALSREGITFTKG